MTDTTTKTEQRIIAVGYEIDFLVISDLLEQHRPGIKGILKNHVDKKVTSGVFYSAGCRGVDREDMKSEQDMTTWFKRRIGKVTHGKLRKLHISRRQDLVIGEMQFGQDLIYAFILNTENKATSQQKKLVYKKDPLFTTIETSDIQVPCRPYMYTEVKTMKKKFYTSKLDEEDHWSWSEESRQYVTGYE